MERRRLSTCDYIDIRTWMVAEPQAIAEHLTRWGFDALFVDEAQDLSSPEWAFVDAWLAEQRLLLAVGDGDQAINEFRGAEVSGLTRLADSGAVEVVELPVTWRAKGEVAGLQRLLRASLFPGRPDLRTVHPGGHRGRRMIHAGSGESLKSSVLHAMCVEILATLGRSIPRGLRNGLPVGYDQRFLEEIRALALRDLSIFTATNKDAEDVVNFLGEHKLEVLRLERKPPDPLAGRSAQLLLAALDPWGETSTYPRCYPARGICTMLAELAYREGKIPEWLSTSVTDHLKELVALERQGRGAVISAVTEWLDSLDGHLSEDTATFLARSRRIMDAVIHAEPSVAGSLHIISEAHAVFNLHRPKSTDPTAAVTYAEKLCAAPVETARGLREWVVRTEAPDLVSVPDDSYRVVVSTINQAKGLTFAATWVCALHPRTFPYRGEDSHGERCRFWVACTRPTDLLVVHVHDSDRRYLEETGTELFEVSARERPLRRIIC